MYPVQSSLSIGILWMNEWQEWNRDGVLLSLDSIVQAAPCHFAHCHLGIFHITKISKSFVSR